MQNPLITRPPRRHNTLFFNAFLWCAVGTVPAFDCLLGRRNSRETIFDLTVFHSRFNGNTILRHTLFVVTNMLFWHGSFALF